MTTTRTFHYPFPAGPESAPYSAGRIEIPKGTTALRITGSVQFPADPGEHGIIALLGLRAGSVEGRRTSLGTLTVGRRGQWRLEGPLPKPNDQKGGGLAPWQGRAQFDLEWSDAQLILEAAGKEIRIDTGGSLREGGVLFIGMESGGKGAEYVPLFGGVISGEITFEGAEEERPTDPLPPPIEGGQNLGEALRQIRIWTKEIESLSTQIREMVARIGG